MCIQTQRHMRTDTRHTRNTNTQHTKKINNKKTHEAMKQFQKQRSRSNRHKHEAHRRRCSRNRAINCVTTYIYNKNGLPHPLSIIYITSTVQAPHWTPQSSNSQKHDNVVLKKEPSLFSALADLPSSLLRVVQFFCEECVVRDLGTALCVHWIRVCTISVRKSLYLK